MLKRVPTFGLSTKLAGAVWLVSAACVGGLIYGPALHQWIRLEPAGRGGRHTRDHLGALFRLDETARSHGRDVALHERVVGLLVYEQVVQARERVAPVGLTQTSKYGS